MAGLMLALVSLHAPHVLGHLLDTISLNCAYLQYGASWAHVAGMPAIEMSVSPSVSLHGFDSATALSSAFFGSDFSLSTLLAVPEEMLELLVDALVVVFALMLVDVALVVVDPGIT